MPGFGWYDRHAPMRLAALSPVLINSNPITWFMYFNGVKSAGYVVSFWGLMVG